MVITFFLSTFKKIIVYVPFLPFRADQSKLIPLIEFIKAIPISKGYISFIYFCTHPIIKLLFFNFTTIRIILISSTRQCPSVTSQLCDWVYLQAHSFTNSFLTHFVLLNQVFSRLNENSGLTINAFQHWKFLLFFFFFPILNINNKLLFLCYSLLIEKKKILTNPNPRVINFRIQ